MPTKLLHDTDSEVESFVVNKDHYHALQNPSDDEAGRTPPGALEWLFDESATGPIASVHCHRQNN